MMDRRISHVIVLVAGLVCGAAGATLLQRPSPSPKVLARDPAPAEPSEGDDEDSILAANANLVRDLQDCNRKLGNEPKRAVLAPSATASTAGSPSRAER